LIFEHIDMWVKKCYPEIQAAALGEIDDGTDGTCARRGPEREAERFVI
jgi:hypothetical protein